MRTTRDLACGSYEGLSSPLPLQLRRFKQPAAAAAALRGPSPPSQRDVRACVCACVCACACACVCPHAWLLPVLAEGHTKGCCRVRVFAEQSGGGGVCVCVCTGQLANTSGAGIVTAACS